MPSKKRTRTPAKKRKDDNIENLFHKFDENGSGNIDVKEFQRLAFACGETLSDEQSNKILNSLDKNNNGTIDLAEFRVWLNSVNGEGEVAIKKEPQSKTTQKSKRKKDNIIVSKSSTKSSSKRTKSRKRTQIKEKQEDYEVWPVFYVLIRVMIASWFLFSVYDRFSRKNGWKRYIKYQESNFQRMGWKFANGANTSNNAEEGSPDSQILPTLFYIVTLTEVAGALFFMLGFEKLGIDLLIYYLLFTGVCHVHFWDTSKNKEANSMYTLAFTQILTVLGLLLYARESLARTSYKELNWEKEVEEEEKEETPQVPTKKKKTNRKTKSQVATLERIRSRIDTIDFGTIGTASHEERDDLQRISGIGPFIEEKLHTLEIFTFRQIAAMTPEIEDQVNIAIEFFIGRIRRDEWCRQAQEFVNDQGYD